MIFFKVRENDPRKMTSCTRKTSNVACINTMLPNEMVLVPLQKLKIKYELSYQSTTRLKYVDKFALPVVHLSQIMMA
jgi:DNA-binding sugar fermentation-stimulating protein